MTDTRPTSTPHDRLMLALALRQSCSTIELDEDGWSHPTTEAIRCLGLLLDALNAAPPPHDGPAQRHINWALVVRDRAKQALITLPEDRTAPTQSPKARVGLGMARRTTGDWIFDTFVLDQSWLNALRDNLDGALASPGCEDARSTADTVRDVVRCAQTYLTEAELGLADKCLAFTCNDTDNE